MSVRIEAPGTFRLVVHYGTPDLDIFPYAAETAFRAGIFVYDPNGLWLTLANVPATNTDAPADGATWRLLAGAAVVARLFAPKDSDQWQHYQGDHQHWASEDVLDEVSFYTGAPAQGTIIGFTGGATDCSGIVRVRESLRSRPSSYIFEEGYEPTRARSIGDILYYHADGPYIGAKYLKFTVTAIRATQGDGNARYRDLTVTTDQVGGDFYEGDAGYLRVSDDAPIGQVVPGNQVGLDNGFLRRLRDLTHWPVAMASGMAAFIQANKALDPLASGYTSLRGEFRDLLNTVFARLDASNLTVMFRSNVRGPWEPYTVTADQTRKAYAAVDSDNEWGLNSVPVIGGAAVSIAWRLDQENYAEVVAHWSVHRRIVFPNGVLLITGFVNELGNRTLQANVKLLSGTLPAIDATARPAIRGVPTWNDVVTALRAAGTADDDHLATEKAIRDAVDAGDDEAHAHIGLVAEFLDDFYEGWTSVDGANYSDANDIVNNLPVDLSSDNNATVPTADQPVILRPNNVTWTDGPAGIVWGFDFLSGDGRYVLGITAAGDDQIVYKRDGNNWSKLWEDGAYEAGAASDPVFMDHWWDVSDGDVKLADALETRRHQWSIPGISDDLMGLYRRGTGSDDGKDVAAMFPNYGGGNIIDYSWNRFSLLPSADYLTKSGTHRRNVTELASNTAALPGLSLITAAYTPKVANARIFVKARVVAAIQGDSDNDYAGLTMRVKRGGGNYKRIDEGADGYTKVWWRRMWQYWDSGGDVYFDEFELEPQNNTDEIKVNVSLYSQDGATQQNRPGRLNRSAGEGMRNAGPSYIEIYEMVEGGKMTYQTTNTLDAA